MKAYNLDSVTVTDRAATGSTPDGAPATGGGGTGGGGSGPTGPAGGDLTGIYPNPGVPGKMPIGGSAYQRLIKTASPNFSAAWYSGSVIDGADYIANGSTLQAAFNAALAASAVLLLPPGITTANLSLPSSTTAYNVCIRGCGQNASVLNGTLEIISTANITLTLEDFSIGNSTASTTTGLVIDLNGGPGLAGGNTNGCIHNLSVFGCLSYAGGTHAVYLNNCDQFVIGNIAMWGAYGAGSASACALTAISCSNLMLDQFCCYFYQKGLNLPSGPTGDCISNFTAVACQYGIYATLGVNQGIFLTNFIIDNGNSLGVGGPPYVTGCVPIFLQGPGSGINACSITNGEILMAFTDGVYSGAYGIQLDNMEHVMISGVDFTFADPSSCCIKLSSGTSNCHITGCCPGQSTDFAIADAATTGTYCLNNIAGTTNVDNGTNHFSNS